MSLNDIAVSVGKGRAAASDVDIAWLPRRPDATKRGVILLHGAGQTAPSNFRDFVNYPNLSLIAQAIANAGLVCVATDVGGTQTYGNDTALSGVVAARTWLNTLGCKTDKVLLVGASMGATTALRYAAENLGQVAAVAGIMPLSDIDDFRDNNRLSGRDLVNTAAGTAAGSTSATVALPASMRLLARAQGGALAGLRWRGYYSTADTVIPQATVQAMATAIGATASTVQVSTTADHGDGIVAAVSQSALTSYLLTYA